MAQPNRVRFGWSDVYVIDELTGSLEYGPVQFDNG